MASNCFGNIFRFTTWGESHGPAVGAVIDGCPAGLLIELSSIQKKLDQRAPGKHALTSPRKESDQIQILSGVFEGKTTGAPINLMILNHDSDSSKYAPIKNQLRPGHANYTTLKKYAHMDDRGGGRASARETAARVAVAAFAEAFLDTLGIQVSAYLKSVGPLSCPDDTNRVYTPAAIKASRIHCPIPKLSAKIEHLIQGVRESGDSIGGTVAFQALNVPPGIGDPIYEKLEAQLAKAMMSLPASKGFEIGEGFRSSQQKGSEHNDIFYREGQKIKTRTNHSGGLLGGMSSGMPLIGSVAFKPPSSIFKKQDTLTLSGAPSTLMLPKGSRHDPCTAIRAVPIVQALCEIVLMDAILLNRCAQVTYEA